MKEIFSTELDVLGKLGYTVIVSNYSEYYRLIDYFASYTSGEIGVAMGESDISSAFKYG